MIDTLKLSTAWENAGMAPEQAKQMVTALAGEITDLSPIAQDVAVIKSELTFHRWVFGLIIGLEFVILGKLFF